MEKNGRRFQVATYFISRPKRTGNYIMNFGEILKEAREKHNDSMREAAKKVGVCLSYYFRMERCYQGEKGGKFPSIKVLKKISECYGLDLDVLKAKASAMNITSLYFDNLNSVEDKRYLSLIYMIAKENKLTIEQAYDILRDKILWKQTNRPT
jgi:transcriptional regulator with XRE-family HTH domain